MILNATEPPRYFAGKNTGELAAGSDAGRHLDVLVLVPRANTVFTPELLSFTQQCSPRSVSGRQTLRTMCLMVAVGCFTFCGRVSSSCLVCRDAESAAFGTESQEPGHCFLLAVPPAGDVAVNLFFGGV